jgi:hypothetical protein
MTYSITVPFYRYHEWTIWKIGGIVLASSVWCTQETPHLRGYKKSSRSEELKPRQKQTTVTKLSLPHPEEQKRLLKGCFGCPQAHAMDVKHLDKLGNKVKTSTPTVLVDCETMRERKKAGAAASSWVKPCSGADQTTDENWETCKRFNNASNKPAEVPIHVTPRKRRKAMPTT